jgi:hypothetical protein
MDAADVVKDLTLAGAAHFHASYVAKKLGVSTDEAHEKLAALQQQGILEVHFDVICPETDRTIKSYKLKEEVPLGEFFVEETGDCEPFELQESDLIVTYSPTSTYTRRLLRDGEHSGSKKKTSLVRRIRRIASARLRRGPSIRIRIGSSTSTSRISSTAVPARRSRRPGLMAQR